MTPALHLPAPPFPGVSADFQGHTRTSAQPRLPPATPKFLGATWKSKPWAAAGRDDCLHDTVLLVLPCGNTPRTPGHSTAAAPFPQLSSLSAQLCECLAVLAGQKLRGCGFRQPDVSRGASACACRGELWVGTVHGLAPSPGTRPALCAACRSSRLWGPCHRCFPRA